MELFRDARAVRLRSLRGQYVVAEGDEVTVALHHEETHPLRDEDRSSAGAWWSVEFILNSDSVLRLKSCYGKYLAASNPDSILGMTSRKVLQSLPPLLDSSSLEWEPVMEGTHVKLRTRYGTLLHGRRSRYDVVTHDFPDHTELAMFLWDVDREEEASVMELFRNAGAVRLLSHPSSYLVADRNETVHLDRKGSSTGAQWSVEFVPNSDSDSVIRLKSCYGKYLAASDKPTPLGMTGCEVLQSLPPHLDCSLEWELVMEGTHVVRTKRHPDSSLRFRPAMGDTNVKLRTLGTNVKLRTHHKTFLHANGTHDLPHHTRGNSVADDLPHRTSILWDVEVAEREEKGSATKRCQGEGSSVTKNRPGDSRPIGKDDRLSYRGHFWKLKNLLWDDSGRKDVLVEGGSGTTALVREVCADVQERFDIIAWISIPQNNESEFREEILLQLIFERAAFPDYTWMLKDQEFSLQQEARCLIVVDNFDDQRTLEKFKKISPTLKRCQVIFIARPRPRSRSESDKNSSCSRIHEYGREFQHYDLGNLSDVPRAYHDILENGSRSPSKEVGQLIFRKCERLNEAIVLVLHSLKERKGFRPIDIKDKWEAKIPSVNLFHELGVIQQVLKTLYKGDRHDPIQRGLEILHNDARRFCFLYLSIFPKNHQFSRKTVPRLWAAEGFLHDLGRAELFLNNLHVEGFIHPLKKGSDEDHSTFQVDNPVRETIASLFDLQNLITMKSQDSTNCPERVRYLSVQGKIEVFNKEQKLSSTFADVSSIEDKTNSEALPLETSKTPLFPNDSRVLDLTGAPFQDLPDKLFNLTRLRYLSLRNTSIKEIPGSIEKLIHLEFLDVKHSLVTELPQQAAKLKEIRHILIYHHETDPLMESSNLIGFKAHCQIRGFTSLEKLCFVEADKRTLKDLGNLTKLTRLGITKLRTTQGKLLCSSLEKLTGLQSLNVHAFQGDEIIDLGNLSSPPQNLNRLYLHGRLTKLPEWILSLKGLTKIILRWSRLKEDLLATLGRLPNLLKLELRRAYDVEQLDFKNGQFPKLKILLLDELEELRSMSLQEETMISLENLTISRCQWLKKIPSGIEHLPEIKKLTFFDMSREFYEKVEADHEKDDYEKFKHISEVYFTQWRAGHWRTCQVESTGEALLLPLGKKHR